MSKIEKSLSRCRKIAQQMATLSTVEKNEALVSFADLIEKESANLLKANALDLKRSKGKISESNFQRLKLDLAKMAQLVQGIHDIVKLDDPAGRVQWRRLLDDGLVLEKRTVPLGVIGVIFESRPDVFPQIVSLMLKSGNVVVMKGGQESIATNKAFMKLISLLEKKCTYLPKGFVTLLEDRAAAQQMLRYPQYVDLVIPRGSNALVRWVMSKTKIPVLGHADGVCHLYVHSSADLEMALSVALDAKTQYPAVCNAIETLLVDKEIADKFLTAFAVKAETKGVQLKGCPQSRKTVRSMKPAKEKDWRTEYGALTLNVRVVPSMEEAVNHINTYGSHHTDAIIASDEDAKEFFLSHVDSASVFANASTRFADGFRYGFGAEVGISTARIHARGPVGLEGLVTDQYRLRGHGHRVADYVGENARPFRHEDF